MSFFRSRCQSSGPNLVDACARRIRYLHAKVFFREIAPAWQRQFILIEGSVDYVGRGDTESAGWNECPCRPEGGHAGIVLRPGTSRLSPRRVRVYRAPRRATAAEIGRASCRERG